MCLIFSGKVKMSCGNQYCKMTKGISDLALLPPCKDNLNLHISRPNYVASMYVHAIKLHMCLDDPIYQQMETKRQFNGEMNAFLKRSQMFWKLLTGKMIMLSNSNLLMTKSAIPVTLKNRWCYNNVGTTTDVDLCTFDF